MSFNIVLIGAGNIGSRHLQALKLTKTKIQITVCEPDEEAISTARARYNQYSENPNIQKIIYVKDFKELPQNQDFVIIATSAQKRFEIASWCVDNLTIQYMLLEKVVFQKMQDFEEFEKKIKNKNVKVWINCPRRMYNFYKDLKKQIQSIEKLDMIVSGSEWGLGCNAIHMLDLYQYLTQFQTYEYDIKNLDEGYFESKRKGYFEFSGELDIKTDKGNLSLKCYKGGNMPSAILIDGEKVRGEILEDQGKAYMQFEDRGWRIEENSFDVQYQSELTNKIVEQLIEHGTCELTEYEDTIVLHRIILSAFMSHINKSLKNEVERCPIT